MNRIPMSVADIVDAAAKGRIGHKEAIERLGLGSYGELVETMRANGRSLWAHAPRPLSRDTLAVLRLAFEGPGRSAETKRAKRPGTSEPLSSA